MSLQLWKQSWGEDCDARTELLIKPDFKMKHALNATVGSNAR